MIIILDSVKTVPYFAECLKTDWKTITLLIFTWTRSKIADSSMQVSKPNPLKAIVLNKLQVAPFCSSRTVYPVSKRAIEVPLILIVSSAPIKFSGQFWVCEKRSRATTWTVEITLIWPSSHNKGTGDGLTFPLLTISHQDINSYHGIKLYRKGCFTFTIHDRTNGDEFKSRLSPNIKLKIRIQEHVEHYMDGETDA